MVEGDLRKEDQTGIVRLRLNSQLQTASSQSYSFSGSAQLAQKTYTLTGTERGAGVVYQTSAPQGRVLAQLLEGNSRAYCLEGSASYADNGSLTRLFLILHSASNDETICTGEIVARGELFKVGEALFRVSEALFRVSEERFKVGEEPFKVP